MSEWDDYFTSRDKPFSENINTALLLANVFDMTVPVELPTMFSNGEFVDTSGRRKCSVAITQIVDNTDLTINAGSIVGTGSLDLKFYPNFNSYGSISKVEWVVSSGTVTVDIYDANDNLIASDIPNGVLDVQSTSIKTLQNFKFRLNFTSATLTGFKVTMVNKNTDRWGATVGISDVTGLQADLDSKVDKVDIHFVTLTASSYNVSIDNSVTLTCKVTDSTGSPMSGYEVQLYKDGTSLGNDYKADTDSDGLATFNYTCDDWGLIDFSIESNHCQVNVTGWRVSTNEDYTIRSNDTFVEFTLNHQHQETATSSWTDYGQVFGATTSPAQTVNFMEQFGTVMLRVNSDGKVQKKSITGSAVSVNSLVAYALWKKQ